MQQIKAYHRPTSVDEVLKLLNRTDVTSVLVAGGTTITPQMREAADEVVDLQAVGLDTLEQMGDRLTLGAMVRLQDVADHKDTPALLREMIRYEAPSTFRNMATIGGVVASADWESEALAALLVFDALLTIQTSSGTTQVTLADFLADPAGGRAGGLITSVQLTTSGQTAHERVARTPMDRPIVAVCGRRLTTSEIRLAVCGVAETPLLCDPDQLDQLNPPADFRGSSAYRKQMALTLSRRVLSTLA